MKLEISVKVLSPLHLGSGEADVALDAEIVHDALGLPYFPGRRFKGLLYESALEVEEMLERSGMKLPGLTANVLFRHSAEGGVQLAVPNLSIAEKECYEAVSKAWAYLEAEYPELLRPTDVLETYASLRYATSIDDDGVAADGSLRNMRVLEEGAAFSGVVEVLGAEAESALPLLAAALHNLRSAGGRRSRGLGEICCRMKVLDGKQAGKTSEKILKEVLSK